MLMGMELKALVFIKADVAVMEDNALSDRIA